MVSYPVGMGFCKQVYLPNGVLDFIPGDVCCNSILVTTAYVGTRTKSEFKIYHNSITTTNPYKIH